MKHLVLKRNIPSSARRSGAAIAALGLAAATAVAMTTPAHAAATSATTLVVNADQPFRPVTHVATGSRSTAWPRRRSRPTAWSSRCTRTPSCRCRAGGHQQPNGEPGPTCLWWWRRRRRRPARSSWTACPTTTRAGPTSSAGAPGRPRVDTQIAAGQGLGHHATSPPTSCGTSRTSTWLSANGTFEASGPRPTGRSARWTPTTPIQGPSFSDNISDMQNFLQNAVATNTVPDIIAWHELESSSKIAGDVADRDRSWRRAWASARARSRSRSTPPRRGRRPRRRWSATSPSSSGSASHNAELAFWNQSGALGDLLTGQGGAPNGAYWLYAWYAAMTGNMVTTTPPAQTGLDGAASVTSDGTRSASSSAAAAGPTAVTVSTGSERCRPSAATGARQAAVHALARPHHRGLGADHDLAEHLPDRQRLDHRPGRR